MKGGVGCREGRVKGGEGCREGRRVGRSGGAGREGIVGGLTCNKNPHKRTLVD